jgi:DNA segregation ATPase FtsK/SpoIIIE-like protein
MPPALAALPALMGAAGGIGTAVGATGTMATVLNLAGTGLGIFGSIVSGISEMKTASANASAAKQEAKFEKQKYTEEARRQREQNEEATSTQIAKLGASGVDLLGSPLDVIARDAGRGELAARDIEQRGKGAQQAKSYEADLWKYRRGQALTNMAFSIGGQAISGAKTILGGTKLGTATPSGQYSYTG